MEFKSPKWWKEFKALGRKHQASSLGGPAKSQAPSSKPQASSNKQGGPAHNQAPDFVKKKNQQASSIKRVGPPTLKPPTATT